MVARRSTVFGDHVAASCCDSTRKDDEMTVGELIDEMADRDRALPVCVVDVNNTDRGLLEAFEAQVYMGAFVLMFEDES